ncbi:hypothetical protein AB4486_15070 [Vibrio sp. 10N.222.55.C6]|uniref:hypothetical protein n=1 Tax=Vibrio sp. 10N.222.55.C6 TaxID=3229649 RepID=UPI00354E20C5
MLKSMLGWLALNPKAGLERQPLFWICIFMPIVIALGLGAPVWIKYELAFTAEAYSTFLDISKLPLGVTSLAIPLAVLIGKLHGAKQAAEQLLNAQKQIRNAEQDNRTKLYLAHYEHFIDHFNTQVLFTKSYNSLGEPWTIRFDRKQLYQNLYPHNGLIFGVGEGDTRVVDDALLSCSDIMEDCSKLVELSRFEQDVDKAEKMFASIDYDLSVLEDRLSLQFSAEGRRDENQTWLQFIAATVKTTTTVLSSIKSFDNSFYSDDLACDVEFGVKGIEFDKMLNQLDDLDEITVNELMSSLDAKGINYTQMINFSNLSEAS